MIAAHTTDPECSRRQAEERSTALNGREGEPFGAVPADHSSAVAAPFQPLDPGVVNQAIPAFFIGRNKDGFWVARHVKGQIGGIFLLKNSALSFAKRNSQPAGCATIFPSERFELDLENKGNALVAQLGSLLRLTTPLRKRMAAFIDRMAHRLISTP
jgi:hypothetical protein